MANASQDSMAREFEKALNAAMEIFEEPEARGDNETPSGVIVVSRLLRVPHCLLSPLEDPALMAATLRLQFFSEKPFGATRNSSQLPVPPLPLRREA